MPTEDAGTSGDAGSLVTLDDGRSFRFPIHCGFITGDVFNVTGHSEDFLYAVVVNFDGVPAEGSFVPVEHAPLDGYECLVSFSDNLAQYGSISEGTVVHEVRDGRHEFAIHDVPVVPFSPDAAPDRLAVSGTLVCETFETE